MQNIPAGERTSVMKRKGQYLMPAGNAIERVHKNVQELRNFMMNENHFPYVVFLQGSNFATEPVELEWPDGTIVPISPSDSMTSRIDRVTASNYGMNIGQDHCKNLFVDRDGKSVMPQVVSIYAQAERFSNEKICSRPCGMLL